MVFVLQEDYQELLPQTYPLILHLLLEVVEVTAEEGGGAC
jgi:hypothetical protein